MQKLEWQKTIQASADPQRVKQGLDQLKATNAAAYLRQASPEEARILVALLSGSQALGQLLLKHPDWIPETIDPGRLRHPRQEQGMRREVTGWLRPLVDSRDYPAALARLRLFKQREMLRIAARDLRGVAQAGQVTGRDAQHLALFEQPEPGQRGRVIARIEQWSQPAIDLATQPLFLARMPKHPGLDRFWEPSRMLQQQLSEGL